MDIQEMKSSKVLPPIKACSDVLTFGKYRGKTVEFVLDHNPGYIEWLSDNQVCEVDEEIYQQAQLWASADREYQIDDMPRSYGDLD